MVHTEQIGQDRTGKMLIRGAKNPGGFGVHELNRTRIVEDDYAHEQGIEDGLEILLHGPIGASGLRDLRPTKPFGSRAKEPTARFLCTLAGRAGGAKVDLRHISRGRLS